MSRNRRIRNAYTNIGTHTRGAHHTSRRQPRVTRRTYNIIIVYTVCTQTANGLVYFHINIMRRNTPNKYNVYRRRRSAHKCAASDIFGVNELSVKMFQIFLNM